MTEQSDYRRGGPCPDCGSTETTLYPVDDEGHFTLYCDTCKREEPAPDPYVMQLAGGVEGLAERAPEMAALIGQYVVRYEPQLAPRGEQWLWTTPNLDEALAFDDPAELHAVYAQSIGTRPWDGKPDRPITVFTITVARRSVFERLPVW